MAIVDQLDYLCVYVCMCVCVYVCGGFTCYGSSSSIVWL